jgi:predicted permease
MALTHILLDIIAPIFVLIGMGFFFEKKSHFDLQILTKTLLYLIMPATLITTLSTSELSSDYIWDTLVFCLAMLILLYLLSALVARVLKYNKNMTRAFNLSVMYYNSGNFGFPASDLAFPGLGLAVQSIILSVQNFLIFTLGIFVVSTRHISAAQAFKQMFKMPFIYAVTLAWCIRSFEIDMPPFIWLPLEYLTQALIPMALLALGIQLAKTKISHAWQVSIVSLCCRLLLSPVMGFGLVILLDIDRTIAPILVLSTSYPTAINTVLLAMEFDSEEEFAANAVFLSTVWSIITVATVIFLVKGGF